MNHPDKIQALRDALTEIRGYASPSMEPEPRDSTKEAIHRLATKALAPTAEASEDATDSGWPQEQIDKLDAVLAKHPAARAAPVGAEDGGDAWITAQVARHLDSQYASGFGAGWNAGIEGDEEQLRRVQARVRTRAEYAELFPAAPAAPIAEVTPEMQASHRAVVETSHPAEHAKPEPVEREQFEAWARKQASGHSLAYNDSGNYADYASECAWAGWHGRGQQAGAVDGEAI